MGHTTRTNGIEDFWPDDTDTKFYLNGDITWTMADIIELASKKWPKFTLDGLVIGSEYIHTQCLYYDQYDPGDYTCFVTVEYKG